MNATPCARQIPKYILLSSLLLLSSWSLWTLVRPSPEHPPYPPSISFNSTAGSSALSRIRPAERPPKLDNAYPHLSSASSSELAFGNDIALIIKTGATESSQRLPSLAATLLQHVPHYLLFSDLPQKFGDYVLRDSLDTFNADLAASLSEFNLYRKMKTEGVEGLNDKNGAWVLDKYKNLHIANKTLSILPDKKWYLFVDADTYIFWHNLLAVLKPFASEKDWFIGNPAFVGPEPFCHGGSGYLVSGHTIRRTFGKDPQLPAKHEKETSNVCCGDFIFGRIMTQAGIKVTNAKRSLQGEPVRGVYFEEKFWCRPVVSLHHVVPVDFLTIWSFEREMARTGRTIVWKDIFERFIWPELEHETENGRESWDNLSDSRKEKGEAEKSDASKCRQKCIDDNSCVQWKWRKGECFVSWSVRLGKKHKEQNDEKKWRSGWLVDRIQGIRERQGECADEHERKKLLE